MKLPRCTWCPLLAAWSALHRAPVPQQQQQQQQQKFKKKTTREEDVDEDESCEETLGVFTWRCREISPLQNTRRSSKSANHISSCPHLHRPPPPENKKQHAGTRTATSPFKVQLKPLVPLYGIQ